MSEQQQITRLSFTVDAGMFSFCVYKYQKVLVTDFAFAWRKFYFFPKACQRMVGQAGYFHPPTLQSNVTLLRACLKVCKNTSSLKSLEIPLCALPRA